MQHFTIRSPLMVFDRVHRRTGTIERVCVFTNRKSEKLELSVGFDFPEHSWVQIYGAMARTRQPVNGRPLTLEPGDNEVLVSLNTDSFNFPSGAFKGRISFQEGPEKDAAGWIEINFEDIQDLEPFLGYAAIDLGTSSSAVSLYHIRKDAASRMPWTPRLGTEEDEVPSAVFIRSFPRFLRRAAGGALVGEEALQAYRSGDLRDPRCLQLRAKRAVGEPRILVADEKGQGGWVDPREVLYALGKHLRERSQNHPGVSSLLKKVSVTFPPTWSYRQLARWRELFKSLGFADGDLDMSLDEASAAGLFYIYNCLRDRDSFAVLLQDLLESETELSEGGRAGKGYTLNLLSVDFGGGTIDLALLEARLEIFEKRTRLRLSLLGSDSCDWGGDAVTLAVFRILKRRLALSICDPARMRGERAPGEDPAAPAAGARPARPASKGAPLRRGLRETFLLPDAGSHGPGSLPIWTDGDGLEGSRELLRQNWGWINAHVADTHLGRDLEDAVEAFFPTRFLPSDKDLFRGQAQRRFDWLWSQAETLKRKLFADVARDEGAGFFPSFDGLGKFRRGISPRGAPDRKAAELPWAEEPVAEAILSAGADEVYQAIREPLEAALARAAKLGEGRRVDRAALSGRSSRIPLVRWMLTRPRGEGGLGIPPARIHFDEANAKASVSKGACLLQVMRETLVGFEVDVADFKANLLADIFYLHVDGTRRVLFPSGSMDDFSYVQDGGEGRSLPRFLSVFSGSEKNLIGLFLLGEEGEPLPAPPASVRIDGQPPGAPPSHPELLSLREKDRSRYARWVAALLLWQDRERIAWMERSAKAGTPEEPIHRFYLTRNHQLFTVRDAGSGGKRLFELQSDEGSRLALSQEEDPFSGVH